MHEGPPAENIDEMEQKKKEIIALSIELSKNPEGFPFPGVESEFYSKTKSEEKEFPSYATPIDGLIKRFENEGMKVVLGKNPESGNVFILPSESDDIENDSIFPKHLQINEAMDEKLKKLILIKKG